MSFPDLSAGNVPPMYPFQPDFESDGVTLDNHITALPPPIHIYTIPVHLRDLVTLDISVIHSRSATTANIRELLKCFHHTIPRVRMQTKPQLVDSFIYYVVPILRQLHVFDRERGIIYSFDVPFQIELQPVPEPQANDAGDGGLNHGEAHGAA
ncbi:uncharacterized protein MELLADRAFT_69832 [Melampsora larici-populina 98AG31]|uniref:Uncharacterized protein n=1 Tax=Melampsora larici-populina (strain 98AG31 / pathotype 3-4-7) TaxID=747676 RepID=F4SCD7_MELLP|nr:uncharacterized protein MELLADRAFT_69832 [Melampsora larici-populina 98AG31]EGF97693.1 hypothetical protein MELLADRAFT_69832 [Melampsora larici-populina 98AG31]